jgi:5-methylcytosine-specific restriction endonuclease McrA
MSRKKFTLYEKQFVEERAKHCCEYCKFPVAYSHDTFHNEHIIPFYITQNNELDNLAFCCDGCNSHKWVHTEGIDHVTNTIVPLFNPRQNIWQDHFEWHDNFTIIIGKTPIGRATIDVLKMNRQGLVNIRKALFAYGVLPID